MLACWSHVDGRADRWLHVIARAIWSARLCRVAGFGHLRLAPDQRAPAAGNVLRGLGRRRV